MYRVPTKLNVFRNERKRNGGHFKSRLHVGASVLAISLSIGVSASAQSVEWDGSGSTEWDSASNWIGGVPTAQSDVVVDFDSSAANGPIVSTLDQSAGSLTIGTVLGGNVNINGGGVLTTGPLIVGEAASGGLFVNAGGLLLSSGAADFGQTSGRAGTGNIRGGTWNHTGALNVGAGGTGAINVTNGGEVSTNGAITLGSVSGATGTLNISGRNGTAGSFSQWSHIGDVLVGGIGDGIVKVSNGGAFNATEGTFTIGENGEVYIGNDNLSGNAPGVGGAMSLDGLQLDGKLNLNQETDGVTVTGDLTGDGEIFVKRGELSLEGDAGTYSGVINLASNATTVAGSDDPYAWLHVSGNLGAGATVNGNLDGNGNYNPSDSVKSAMVLEGAGGTYTVGAQINGYFREFQKTGNSTAILDGDNSFQMSGIGGGASGFIEVEGGTLQISSDGNLGNAANNIVLSGGTLATSADMATSRGITLASSDGGFNVADDTTFDINGAVAGAGALNLAGGGMLDIRDAAASYNGGVNVSTGTLIGNADTIRGAVDNDGTVIFDQDIAQNWSGTTSGSGDFVKEGESTLGLTGSHATDWIVNQGTLAATAGLFTGGVEIAHAATFRFDTQSDTEFAGEITGNGTFNKTLGGTLTLAGDNAAFAGDTVISAGIVLVDGSLGGNVEVDSLGGLGGTGAIGGNVVVADNGDLFGQQGETLSIGGNVELSSAANVSVTLGAPEAGYNPALFDVAGDVTLDGTIDVTDADDTRGNFRAGVYRIFGYGGALVNNGLEIGGVPTGSNAADLDVQTAIEGQVNLVNTGGQDMHFWDGGLDASKNDGFIQGGDGIWRNGDANWANTNGSANAGWNSGIAIFGGAAGTVTIDDSATSGGAVSATGLQFITDGYVVNGDDLTLVGAEGIAAIGTDAGVTATLDTVLQGTARIDKWGAGTLVLESDSLGYGGSTLVSEGTLLVNGGLGGDVDVDGALGGTGTIGGNVAIADGGRLIGRQGQTLAMGDLTLSEGSDINVALAAPGNQTGLFNVNGDLVLDGTINVSDAGGFGRGAYRVIDYAGSLTDNGLDVGIHPGSWDVSVQTAIDSQVNLVVGSDIQFWNGSHTEADGTIHGGDGIWRNDTRTNWTDENAQDAQSWQQDTFAVFQGEAGTVTVEDSNGQVSVGGIQFGVDGYTVVGDRIVLNADDGQTVVRVGDGTADGADYSAIVEAELTGDMGLEKTDLGTLVLTGENTYSGGTTITNGAIVLGNGGTSGTIAGNVAIGDDAGLIFNRSDEYVFGGVIAGAGQVGQIGTGTTVLTADSSAFAGNTEVINGGLQVDGSLGGIINVRNGALLDGSGSVGEVVVHAGGAIGAGTSGSIDSFNVGDLTFNGGSSYVVNVAADGTGDRLLSSGEVIINGGVVDANAGTGQYSDQTRYTIITADDGVTRGGANEGFDGVTSNLAFLTPSLEYDADNVYLVMDRNDFSFCLPGSTANQCATGDGVESTGPGSELYDTVVNLTDPEARDAFNQLSGEIHASAMTALIEDSRFVREATGDHMRGAFGGVGKPQQVITYEPGIDLKDPTPRAVIVDAEEAQGLALWTRGFGSWGEFDGDGNAADMERDIGGLFVGADVPVFDNMRLGVVGGYSRSSFSVDDRNSSGTSDNYDLGIYGGGQWDQLGVSFGANYTWHDISTDRSVAYRGFSDSLSADYDARTIQVYGDVGYTIDVGETSFEPFAGVAYVNLNTDGFTETGGAAALTGFGNEMNTTFTTIGVRAAQDFDLGEVQMTASGMVGWNHTFGDDTPTSTHQFAGGSPFIISGVPLADDVAVFQAGLDTAINDALSIGISYSGQVGDGVSDHGVRGNLSWKF